MFTIQKRILKYFLLVAYLFSGNPGDDSVKEGVNAFYNYEFERSIQILNQVRQDYPENPIVHLTWVGARWKYNEVNAASEDMYSILSQDIEEVDSIYSRLLEKYPEHPEYLLYLGSTRGLQARILLGQKKWFGTLAAAYQGFKLIKRSAELDPQLMDTYLPLGILEYYAGLSNYFIKSAASYFGLNPVSSSGLEKMERAAQDSEWAWIEAKSVLSYIYLWMQIDSQRAAVISRDLALKFPLNYDFQVHYIESLLQNNQVQKAGELLSGMDKMLEDLTPRQQEIFSSYLDYEWGHYYFLRGDYELALKSFEDCISAYISDLDAVLSFAYLKKGMILDLKQDRRAAMKAYKNCRDLDNFSNAIVLSEQYLKIPYTQESILEPNIIP